MDEVCVPSLKRPWSLTQLWDHKCQVIPLASQFDLQQHVALYGEWGPHDIVWEIGFFSILNEYMCSSFFMRSAKQINGLLRGYYYALDGVP